MTSPANRHVPTSGSSGGTDLKPGDRRPDEGFDIEVPYTPGRADASQEQTDVEAPRGYWTETQ
jgi:hypothetical protein